MAGQHRAEGTSAPSSEGRITEFTIEFALNDEQETIAKFRVDANQYGEMVPHIQHLVGNRDLAVNALDAILESLEHDGIMAQPQDDEEILSFDESTEPWPDDPTTPARGGH